MADKADTGLAPRKLRFTTVDLILVFGLGAGLGFWSTILLLLWWGCSCGF